MLKSLQSALGITGQPQSTNTTTDNKRSKPTPQPVAPPTQSVDIPETFLSPLADISDIEVHKIDFEHSALPEYKKLFAVVLDNVLTQKECDQFIRLAEQSAGAHGPGDQVENNGWVPAMVHSPFGAGVLVSDYRNSDRIMWDNKELVARLWKRVMQAKGMKEYFAVLHGKDYVPVVGDNAERGGMRWVLTDQGVNERMRFLKYGAGQFFRQHCDASFETQDGMQRSFFTIHLYLNDSEQDLRDLNEATRQKIIETEKKGGRPAALPLGGATSFHSNDMSRRIDVNPRAGRVLIFQQKRLLHSGDDVLAGVKYTMRSDIMHEFEVDGASGDADDMFFAGGP